MFKLLIAFILTLPSLSFASPESANTKIKDVKIWLKEIGPENTCADEYLARRKDLSIKLGLSPLSVAGGITAGFLGGGFIGHSTFVLTGQPNDGWADFAYTFGGAAIGTMAAVAAGAASTTATTIKFFNNQRIIKAILESRTKSGRAIKVLHRKYNKSFPEDAISIQEFTDAIFELDSSGKLCDGSLVKPKRFKKGKKLKQRLATKTEIFNHIHEELVK